MTASAKPKAKTGDYVVKDISLAAWGRNEINIAETEMPGLMATREEYGPAAAAQGRSHRGLPAHDHPDGGADRDADCISALTSGGPPATSIRPRTMRPRPIAEAGVPVFAVKGESLVEYWDYTRRIFEWHDGGEPNMILDDGGDATHAWCIWDMQRRDKATRNSSMVPATRKRKSCSR